MKHVLEGRLKRPSPSRIRSAPGRDQVRGLSETNEKCANFVIWAVYARAVLGSWHMQSLNEINIRENINFQVGIISNFWRLISSPPHFFHGHPTKRLAYCRTTAMSLLFDIRFHG